jgi:hypothetical protein
VDLTQILPHQRNSAGARRHVGLGLGGMSPRWIAATRRRSTPKPAGEVRDHPSVLQVGRTSLQRRGDHARLPISSKRHDAARFPPRQLGATKRELFDEWLSRAGDVSLAYVSDRRSDGPRLYGRIVIRVDPDGEQAYTIHATSVGTAWLVSYIDQLAYAEVHGTLRDALNSIGLS